MIYCDTSLIVAALTLERTTPHVLSWMGDGKPLGLCVSPWVAAELSGALAIKLRRGDLTAELWEEAMAQWSDLLAKSFSLIPVPEQSWGLAASYCDRHALGLRASDALHVAIAALGGHVLATLDRSMGEAASALGVAVEHVPLA